MTLRGARVALGPDEAVERDVEVAHGGAPVIDLTGRLLMPGLINAHDHLEFSLYPRLGRGPYANAGDWARDIYRPDRSPIREQLKVPKSTRLLWGGLKNLLSGVTTVCHHNPREHSVFDRNFPVRVLQRFGWAHSLEFHPDVAQRFRDTPPGWPFIVHVAEGVDRGAAREVFDLDALGALDGRTVLTHAVALGLRGLRLAKRKCASIVWCPSSNLFLLGRTLDSKTLESGVPIALGSDSTLTAKGDLLDELRVARRVSRLPPSRLYQMVTDAPTRILRLQPLESRAADLIAIPDCGRTPADSLLRATCPDLVIVGGKVKLISAELARHAPASRLRPLHVEGRGEVFVDADVALLRRRAERALGNELRLAGRRVLA